jgi:hypothetical protein
VKLAWPMYPLTHVAVQGWPPKLVLPRQVAVASLVRFWMVSPQLTTTARRHEPVLGSNIIPCASHVLRAVSEELSVETMLLVDDSEAWVVLMLLVSVVQDDVVTQLHEEL